VEYDLELKTHGFSAADREMIFHSLELLIPNQKVLPCTPSIHANAVQFEAAGGWFDSIIASVALEHSAIVISTDIVFDQLNIPRIW